jgi:hypothetical protein
VYDAAHTQTQTTQQSYAALRREVGMLRARESRRVFDTMVYVGRLEGERESFVVRAQDLTSVDAALRVDVVCALLANLADDPAPAQAWLTRSGAPTTHDVDLLWLAAATIAFGIHGQSLEDFFAITRGGWLDVRSGAHRAWKRLRL